MTKYQALQISAMEGREIRHRYFTEDEFIKVLTDESIGTEEGYKCSFEEFFSIRNTPEWENDWELCA